MLELSAPRELVLQRQEVDFAAELREESHRGEDRAVSVLEEIGGVDRAENAIERVVVDEDGSEDGTFRIGALRQRPIERYIKLYD